MYKLIKALTDKNIELYGLIYKIINLVNDKLYAGQTTQILLFNKGRYKGSGMALKDSYTKYDKHTDYKIELICYASNQEELNSLETFYIKEYNSLAPNGYNLMTGGNQKGFHNEKTKIILSKKRKNKIPVKDKDGDKFRVPILNDDLKSGKFISIHSGRNLSEEHKRNICSSIKRKHLNNIKVC